MFLKSALILFLFLTLSTIAWSQQRIPDSVMITSLDPNYYYFSSHYTVVFVKQLLDRKVDWNDYFDEKEKIYKWCIIKDSGVIKKLVHLLSSCDTSHSVDLSNFENINVRIGLKMFYNKNGAEYYFLESSAFRFVITRNFELRMKKSLVRFLKKYRTGSICKDCS